MSCPFCGALFRRDYGYQCGTSVSTEGTPYRTKECVSNENAALKKRIASLEKYTHGLEVIGDEMKQAALTPDAVKWDAQRARRPQP